MYHVDTVKSEEDRFHSPSLDLSLPFLSVNLFPLHPFLLSRHDMASLEQN